MGAAISVTAANLVMEKIKRTALENFPEKPKVFLRYVDDCFCVIKENTAENFLSQLNLIDPAIQFTTEKETNGTLPFLDALVKRQPEGLNFTVYRKPTHTGRYVQFDFCHPNSHKSSVVSALLLRARTICSTEEDRKKEEKAVIADLKKNEYTTNFIRRVKRRLPESGCNQKNSSALTPLDNNPSPMF
ncbi:uncharacterized protein LOC144180094 [Haemaphysalis longicornis]